MKPPSQPPIFYKSSNTAGTVQNASNTAEAITNVLEELGPQKFSSVVTDYAPVLKAAWEKILEKYPDISAYGYAAHAINLLIKDILEPQSHQNVLSDASVICNLIMLM